MTKIVKSLMERGKIRSLKKNAKSYRDIYAKDYYLVNSVVRELINKVYEEDEMKKLELLKKQSDNIEDDIGLRGGAFLRGTEGAKLTLKVSDDTIDLLNEVERYINAYAVRIGEELRKLKKLRRDIGLI